MIVKYVKSGDDNFRLKIEQRLNIRVQIEGGLLAEAYITVADTDTMADALELIKTMTGAEIETITGAQVGDVQAPESL